MVNMLKAGFTVTEPEKKRIQAYADREKISLSEACRRLVQVGLREDLRSREHPLGPESDVGFVVPEPRRVSGRKETAEDDKITYNEQTLFKVCSALDAAGLSPVGVNDAITEMQNAGILFRERATRKERD